MQILGILNLTHDSFSDGGRFLELSSALAHAEKLVRDGADIIDVGAESTHPDAEDVPAAEEIRRLTPVLRHLKTVGAAVSVDTHKPGVMRAALDLGADLINDVSGFASPESRAAVRDAHAKLIVVHSVSPAPRAARTEAPHAEIAARVRTFFEERTRELVGAGIARARIILDPGMGFFVGVDPRCSLRLLHDLPELAQIGPLCVSTSRKSFIGAVLAEGQAPRAVEQRGAGTLATELWSALHGASYIRTHDVRALRDGLALLDAIRSAADDLPPRRDSPPTR